MMINQDSSAWIVGRQKVLDSLRIKQRSFIPPMKASSTQARLEMCQLNCNHNSSSRCGISEAFLKESGTVTGSI